MTFLKQIRNDVISRLKGETVTFMKNKSRIELIDDFF